jgi:pre-mRNA cleavage complex 2 protein Pcf11
MSKVAEEVAEEYASLLSDLTVISKRLINLLTMLADENIMHAPIIVEAVEKHLQKVIFKVLFDIVTSGGLETSECKS